MRNSANWHCSRDGVRSMKYFPINTKMNRAITGLAQKIPKYKDWEKEFYYTKELLDGIEERHFGGMYNYRGGLYENASGSTI